MLTDAAIRGAKPGPKVRKLSDANGLQLWIMPNGSKLWRLAYRIDGTQRVLAMGAYHDGAVSLGQARELAKAARAVLAMGGDPVQAKRLALADAAGARGQTFNIIADELLANKRTQKRAPATLAKVTWLLSLARPALGPRPIREITSADVLSVLRSVAARGRHESAAKLRAVIGEVFRHALASGRAETDPTQALKGAIVKPPAGKRAAITDPKEFGALLRAIEGYEGQPTTVACLKLMALLFPRPGELRKASWNEFDLDAGVWIIPAERTKMRREHVVPLPASAIAILTELRAMGGEGELMFPGIRSARQPLSEATMNGALRRLGFAKDEMTSHGFRAAASSMLNGCGRWRAEVIEAALAHIGGSEVSRAYNRSEYWAERVEMATWWADKIAVMRDGGDVVELSSRRRAAPKA